MAGLQRAGTAPDERRASLHCVFLVLRAHAQVHQSDLKEAQQPLIDSLLKIIAAPEPYPAPGRPVRNLVAQCLILVYTHGDTKTLFDTIQTLLKPLDTKSQAKDVYKV